MKFSLFHLPTFFPQFHASEAQFYQDMLNETDRAEAREEPREALLRYLRTAGESNREAAYSEQYAAYKDLREGFKLMDYDHLYPQRVIFGDPQQCAERIVQIRASGVTNVGLLANFGGLEHTKVLASLDRFAAQVMPRFH